MKKVIKSALAIAIAVITTILTASMTRAEASLFGLGGQEDQNECPIMSFTCDETPGILEKIYLDDGYIFSRN